MRSEWLLLLLGVVLVAALPQSTAVSSGGAACVATQPPSPPTNLQAVPGDGQLQLTWGAPANNACILTYRITVVPLDARGAALAPLSRQNATGSSATLTGLANGVKLRVFVQAYADKPYFGGGESMVEVTPAAACYSSTLPAAPIALRATPGNGALALCWRPSAENNACIDEWRVAVRVADQGGQPSSPLFRRVPAQTTCTNFTGLQNGVFYEVAVQVRGEPAGGDEAEGSPFGTVPGRCGECSAPPSPGPISPPHPAASTGVQHSPPGRRRLPHCGGPRAAAAPVALRAGDVLPTVQHRCRRALHPADLQAAGRPGRLWRAVYEDSRPCHDVHHSGAPLMLGMSMLPSPMLAPRRVRYRLTRPLPSPAMQYCALECNCSPDPNASLAGQANTTAAATNSTSASASTAAPANSIAEPRVQKMDGGVTARNAAAAEAAATAGRAAGPADPWQSADGCCAVKPTQVSSAEEDEYELP